MKKNNKRHCKTLNTGFVSPLFPQGKQGGETLANEKPTLDELWEWLGDPDKY